MVKAAAVLEREAYKFDAGELGSIWLSVALASGKDDELPVLSRTVYVELFPDGVRLVATDGYVLLTGWIAQNGEPPPEMEEAPSSGVIAIDTHGRGASLMGHLRKLSQEAETSGIQVEATMRIGEPPADPTETLQMDGLETRALIIDHPGREELALPLFEGVYPQWRSILGTHKPVATDAIALNTEIIGRLAKLGKFYGEEPLVWRFGGSAGAAILSMGPVAGAAMPMRWAGIGDPKPVDEVTTPE